MIRLAKQMVRRLAIALGFELRGVGTSGSEQRLHMGDFLTHFAKTGFLPKTIVDCGVADGTYDLYKAFPEAFLLLIEPLEENTEAIQSILTKYNGKFILGAAAAESGKIQFNVHGDHLEGHAIIQASTFSPPSWSILLIIFSNLPVKSRCRSNVKRAFSL